MIIFFVFLLFTLFGMLWVKNSIHMLWWMVISYFISAALINIYGNDFISWILVLVYIGAIVILFLFAIFMLEEIRSSKMPSLLNVLFFLFLIINLDLSIPNSFSFGSELLSIFSLFNQFFLPLLYIIILLFLGLFAVAFLPTSLN